METGNRTECVGLLLACFINESYSIFNLTICKWLHFVNSHRFGSFRLWLMTLTDCWATVVSLSLFSNKTEARNNHFILIRRGTHWTGRVECPRSGPESEQSTQLAQSSLNKLLFWHKNVLSWKCRPAVCWTQIQWVRRYHWQRLIAEGHELHLRSSILKNGIKNLLCSLTTVYVN